MTGDGRCVDCGGLSLAGGRWCRRCMDVRFGPGVPAYVGAVARPTFGAAPIAHGTMSGVKLHLRRREPLCEGCLAANRTYRNRLRDRQAVA